MTPLRRIGVISLCLALTATAFLPPLLRASAPVAPTANTQAGRSPTDIKQEIDALDNQITTIMPSLKLLADPDFRAGDGQKVLPLLRKTIALMTELEDSIKADARLREAQDLIDMVHGGQFNARVFAATLGDKDGQTTLETLAKSNGPDALLATNALTFSRWILASKNADAQQQILDAYGTTAKAHPDDIQILDTLSQMNNLGLASPEMTEKIIAFIRTNLKGPDAAHLASMLDGEQERKALVGKVFALAGRTSTGGTFDTASYKGKVVLLDFWATWCGPCIRELPNVKKTYAANHEKGFEIVGLSCDTGDAVLNDFIKENAMPWVQLRETTQNEADQWHPLAKKYHVDGIPQMFLIDRNGVLRYVDARENLEKKVALLLAETAAPADAKTESKPAAQ